MMGLVFTMMFYGGLIPTYLTVRAVGILNTRLAMVVPQALAVWQVIIARTFFQSTIADELAEAADIDGCSDLGFVWSVVLPLSKPIIAVLVLLYAVGALERLLRRARLPAPDRPVSRCRSSCATC